MTEPKRVFSYFCYRIFRWFVRLLYPCPEFSGLENLPEEPCIVVGNHSQMNGPIIGALYFPGDCAIWCAGQMMRLHEVPEYAFTDFWSGKPAWIRWFFKLLSYIIAPISVCVFNNAPTIGVYRDIRLRSTIRQTVDTLKSGRSVIIYPECYDEHNNIVHEFQKNFVDVARYYYKSTGKALSFVPMYIAPELKKVTLGKPTAFRPDAPAGEERQRVCDYLMDRITDIALHLPPHTVVPYPNIPRKNYPRNTERN